MRNAFAVLAGLLLAALLAAGCDATPTPAPASGPLNVVPVTPVPNLDDAIAVAETFLNAWVNGDYDAMHTLVTPNSRDTYPLEVFRALYEEATKKMTLIDLSYEPLNASVLQGTTAGFAYNMHFRTQVLGDFTDPERIMYLLPTVEGWRVAWSPSDIFFEMVKGAGLKLERVAPARANVYDRNGHVLADQDGVVLTVVVTEQNMPNYESCLHELARVLRLSIDSLREKFDERPDDWVTIVDEIDADIYEVEGARLEEVCNASFEERRTRRYYGGGLASHVIGYVGYIPAEQCGEWELRGYTCDDLIGRVGVEKWGETILAGHRGGRLSIVTPSGERLRQIAEDEPDPSQAIYLTIDRDLQLAVQQAISDGYNNYPLYFASVATGAAAIVMDVRTGEILAMASYPWFDPNIYNPDTPRDAQAELLAIQNDPHLPQLNRATMGVYPPGSVFKIISMTAAADSGVFGLDQTYRCTGEWFTPDGKDRRIDWKAGGHGVITLRQSLTYSCDPYNYQIGYELNQEDPFLLSKYAREFGLGEPTGIEQVDEDGGLIPDPDWKRTRNGTWTYSDNVNMAIGQGDVLVTPLQVARMMAAVANGGTLYQPQLVHHVGIIGEEPTWTMEPIAQRKVNVKPEVLEAVQQSLCAVTTDPEGTATWRYENMEIPTCGKTGTAQAGAALDYPHAWFAAYAPADDPEIAVVVLVEHGGEGSYVSAPIVRRIIEAYYGVPLTPYPPDWNYEIPPIVEGQSLGE
ncbi:MAG: penicillin-binding protein 2 [Anaerolineae bacterium]|nr:penicillin-binding protein 2 [Anaerolineae bacterium]